MSPDHAMPAHPLALLACAALIATPAHAATTEDFSSYKPGQSLATGVTLGAATDGWTGGWRTCSSYSETSGSIKTANPVDSGNYLDINIATTPAPGKASAGAVGRPYAVPTKPFKLTFRFRPATSDRLVRYFIFDNDVRAAGTAATAAWQIDSHAGVWRVIDGARGGQPENYIDTALPITPGTTYVFTLSIDPAARVWSVTITDGKTACTHDALSFRTDKVATERWLHFGAATLAIPATGAPVEYAVDSISLQP